MTPIFTITLSSGLDVIASRQRARHIAEFCGFNQQDQTRVATVVSELARNASVHNGIVQFSVTMDPGRQALVVLVESGSSTIPEIDGAGLFVEQYEDSARGERTQITFRKLFASNFSYLDASDLEDAVRGLGALQANVALSDATQKTRDLNVALLALKLKQAELLIVSKDLEDTNETVTRLNQLIHEKAESLILADRRKDEFLSLLSHELRSPLSATSMAAQMLRRHTSDLAQPARLGELIARQTDHMSRLIGDLLDVSRIGMGIVTIKKKPIDMREVVKIAVEQITPALHRKKHRIEVLFRKIRASWRAIRPGLSK
jgi:signal transduction histidine kinase